QDYQTIFASAEGAIAAPTAGLHFTARLTAQLAEKGIDTVPITLHVGPGTFQPVTSKEVEQHSMHPEWFEVSKEAADRIGHVRQRGGRIVAVGATVARSLDSALDSTGQCYPCSGETRLFILPGYRFRIVDALL